MRAQRCGDDDLDLGPRRDWDSRTWELSRAMAAAHVYVHLMLLLEATRLHAGSLAARWSSIDSMAIRTRQVDLAAKISYLASEMRGRAGIGRIAELGWALLDWVEGLARELEAKPAGAADAPRSAS